MKHFSSTILLLSLLMLFSCKSAPTIKEAIAYNDKISTENNKILEKYDKLLNSYNEYQPEEMDNAYANAKQQVEESIESIKKLKTLVGDSAYRKTAINAFESYLTILNNEHKRMIELLKLPESGFQDAEKEEYEKLIETANSVIDSEIEKLHTVQKEFAKTYKIELVQHKDTTDSKL